MSGCILKVNPEPQGYMVVVGDQHKCLFTILLILSWQLRYSFKKVWAAEKGGVNLEIGD